MRKESNETDDIIWPRFICIVPFIFTFFSHFLFCIRMTAREQEKINTNYLFVRQAVSLAGWRKKQNIQYIGRLGIFSCFHDEKLNWSIFIRISCELWKVVHSFSICATERSVCPDTVRCSMWLCQVQQLYHRLINIITLTAIYSVLVCDTRATPHHIDCTTSYCTSVHFVFESNANTQVSTHKTICTTCTKLPRELTSPTLSKNMNIRLDNIIC